MENAVVAAEISVLSVSPLVGVLKLHTIDGLCEFSVNETSAKEVIASLSRFLDTTES